MLEQNALKMVDGSCLLPYNINMETTFLNQYFNLCFEWESRGIDVDNATHEQIKHMNDLQSKAIEQTGLTCNEVNLIYVCRRYKIFRKINSYARRCIDM